MEKRAAVFDRETERFYRFKITGQEIDGRIYIKKGADIPREILIELSKVDPGAVAKRKVKVTPLNQQQMCSYVCPFGVRFPPPERKDE